MIDFLPADHAAVSSAAKILRSRYRNFVEYEDVQQECYLWLFRNYHKAQQWREELSDRHAERTVIKALRNAGERYCRAEKAEREGYLTEDEFFYSIPMVADLLQLSFDPEWMIPNGVEVGVRPSNNPHGEGGDLNALVADVTKAYSGLPIHDQELLARVYEHGTRSADNVAVLALEWDITTKAADMRVRRVLGRLRAALGGPSPYREEHA